MGAYQHSHEQRRTGIASNMNYTGGGTPSSLLNEQFNPMKQQSQYPASSSLSSFVQDSDFSSPSNFIPPGTPASSYTPSQPGQPSLPSYLPFDGAVPLNDTVIPFNPSTDWGYQLPPFTSAPASVQDTVYYDNQYQNMGICPVAPPQQYQHTSIGQSPEEFEECVKQCVENWALIQLNHGQNPFDRPYNRVDIAESLNVPIGQFAFVLGNMSKTMSQISSEGSGSASPTSISTAVMSTERKAVYKRKLADDYIQKARRDRCDYRKPTKAEGKTFKCIHPGCDSSHERADDWKRHCLRAWPVEVFVCDLCLNQDNLKTKILVTHWKDRLRQHILREHKDHEDKPRAEIVSDVAESSRVPVPDADSFEMTCPYRAPGSRRACGQHLKGIMNCLSHCQTQHFGPELSASNGKDAGGRHGHDCAADTGSNKRSRCSTGSVGRKRRQ